MQKINEETVNQNDNTKRQQSTDYKRPTVSMMLTLKKHAKMLIVRSIESLFKRKYRKRNTEGRNA